MKKEKVKKAPAAASGAKDKTSFGSGLLITLVVIISIALVSSGLVMVFTYSSQINQEAGIVGLRYSGEMVDHLRKAVEAYEAKSEQMAKYIAAGAAQSVEEFEVRLRNVGSQYNTENLRLRYFKDGQEYYVSGSKFNMEKESKSVLDLARRRVTACAGIVSDTEINPNGVAFCVGVDNCEYADVIVFFYFPVFDVVAFPPESLNEEIFADSRITCVCSGEGEIINILAQTDMGLMEHNNIYEEVRPLINDKSVVDGMKSAVYASTSQVFQTEISNENHIICVSSLTATGAAPFAVVSVYRSEDLHGTGYTTVRTVLSVIMIFAALLLILVATNIIGRVRARRQLAMMHDYDEVLDCPTRIKFERTAADILNRNKATAFAVVTINMKHFNYISDHLGAESVTQILLYLKLLYSRMVQLDETYGYMGEGRFVLLLHYRDFKSIEDKLKNVSQLASAYNTRLPTGYHITLYGGVYQTTNGIVSDIGKMIDLAVDAEGSLNFPCDFGSFRIYNDKIHASHAQSEYIEVHMESALRNKEFQIFYQPKLNIAGDRPDGCEALVRWYNPEKDDYMQPGVFIPLFEANRFIVKLDRYVYEQVCEYIEEAASRGQTLYPVSVNVSRISAMEGDFLSYYINIKHKHNIADGFLTLEFTESFAYEDYDMLREIVNTLHKNGFKCSIDDFGTGYSSYSILKELPMDEIKLDRFFLGEGLSRDRDLKVLTSVINVARELNMKVTQEGVETMDQLEMLRKLGCHVIQGYHYSRPLRLSDYIEFIERKTHNVEFVTRGRE
ncbi:MAG: EAL domain-containing protein [Clostridia bacterium]|nr:EAL domain-containing protein [Clostridia bacterium]MBR5942302.1 EAL domain-containing protein [Clostridia bacterium]